MHDPSPFSTAKEALLEAAGWMGDMLIPEGDPDREGETNEDAWEQARSLLSSAIEVLDMQGHDQVEIGGEEVVDYGWVPHFRKDIVDQEAAYASGVVNKMVGTLLKQDTASVLRLITPALIDSLKGVMDQRFSSRLESERETADAQPEPY